MQCVVPAVASVEASVTAQIAASNNGMDFSEGVKLTMTQTPTVTKISVISRLNYAQAEQATISG